MERAALQVMNRSDAYKAKHERLKTGEGASGENEKKQKDRPEPKSKTPSKQSAEAEDAEPDAASAVNEVPA
jgi:hypothetical protein